jgi:hypothetical protein
MIFLKRFKHYSFQYKYDKILYSHCSYLIIDQFLVNCNRISRYRILKSDPDFYIEFAVKDNLDIVTIAINLYTNYIKLLNLACYGLTISKDFVNYYYGFVENLYDVQIHPKKFNYINEKYHKNVVTQSSRIQFYLRDIDFRIDCKAYKLLSAK